jgi:membrane-bound serine protease (ClpP class)
MDLWIPLLLFVIGFIALFLELFIPAVGIIGAVGIICMIIGTVLAYNHLGRIIGSIFLTGTLIGTPAMVVIGLKVFPKTFVGKRLILGDSQERDAGFTSYSGEKYEGLTDKEGIALTTLRPSGMVRIDNKKFSVVTGGEMISKDEKVRVIKVEGSRIIVRKINPYKGSTS